MTEKNLNFEIDIPVEDAAAHFDDVAREVAAAENQDNANTSAQGQQAAISVHPFPPADSKGTPIFNYPTYSTQPVPEEANVTGMIPLASPREESLRSVKIADPSADASMKPLKSIRVINQSTDTEEKKSSGLTEMANGSAVNANSVEKKGHERPSHQDQMRKASVIGRYDALPREYNTQGEVEGVISAIGIKKILNPIDKTIFLGCLSGVWVTFAAIFQVTISGGTTPEFREEFPFVIKLLTGFTFPVALVYIVLFGGELFTGNTMILTVAWLGKRITLRELLLNWLLVFLSNLGSISLLVYLFAYLTGIYEHEPHLEFIRAIAVKKTTYPFWKMILLGVPANALVCLAFFLGLAARDITGKILGLYIPILCFAASGWEHCVANMFYIVCGWMYGANVTVAGFCANLFFVGIGNIIGGAILIGGSEYYLYHWNPQHEPTRHNGKATSPNYPSNRRISQLSGEGSRRGSAGSSIRRVKKPFWKFGK